MGEPSVIGAVGETPHPGRGRVIDEHAQLPLPTQGKCGKEEDKAEVGLFSKVTWSTAESYREW